MPRVTYIEFNGAEHTVEVPVGTTLMRGAVDNNVPGIDADCGGQCACATCHVYVDAAWLDKTGLPEPGSQEATMLSFADNATGNFTKIVQRVPVRIALPANAALTGLLRPGLSVTVTIDTRNAGDGDGLVGAAQAKAASPATAR
jgi:2Fe-2S ferredoxin